MTTLMDEWPGESASLNAAKARGDTQGQHRAELRARKETTAALITLLKRHKRAKARRALLSCS